MDDDKQITAEESSDGTIVITILLEKFSFDSHRLFKQSYAKYTEGKNIVIDFKRVVYIDSSALGMLLLMRETCGAEASKISFVNYRQIKRIFEVANFQRLFEMK